MRKAVLDLVVRGVEHLSQSHVLLRLTHNDPLPTMLPGQFVEVRVDNSPETFLRRPISMHYYNKDLNEMWLLVAAVGAGTRRLKLLKEGDILNCVLPLGNSFSLPDDGSDERFLLVGGGVGVAPLLFLGSVLASKGLRPTFLLGAKKSSDLLQLDAFRALGDVYVTTEDGSVGEQGFVTNHSVLTEKFSHISCCGPLPMMKAVARYAKEKAIPCEVSLENKMACGLGACLCCVEKTTEGNQCVCTEGPVFDYQRLLWDI